MKLNRNAEKIVLSKLTADNTVLQATGSEGTWKKSQPAPALLQGACPLLTSISVSPKVAQGHKEARA